MSVTFHVYMDCVSEDSHRHCEFDFDSRERSCSHAHLPVADVNWLDGLSHFFAKHHSLHGAGPSAAPHGDGSELTRISRNPDSRMRRTSYLSERQDPSVLSLSPSLSLSLSVSLSPTLFYCSLVVNLVGCCCCCCCDGSSLYQSVCCGVSYGVYGMAALYSVQ